MIEEAKQKKQDLGIFYTDQRIADFIFDILKVWKEKEEKEDGRWESRKHYPSVIDPAVGEGVFLKAAIETGLTKTEYIFGLDIDEEVVEKWKSVNLLKEFGGNESDLEAHFFHQNGLDKIHWEQHTDKYRYKLKQKDIDAQQFDTVVGNPPYGGLGLYDEMKKLSDSVYSAKKVKEVATISRMTLFGDEVNKQVITEKIINTKIDLPKDKIEELYRLSKTLLNFNIWKNNNFQNVHANFKINLNGVVINCKDLLTLKEIEKLKSFSIEILFLERFIQLAKPGGWIAIIIPDGILTNSNSHYVRKFIADKAKVEAIVSLPRDAFKNAGTSAKTSILFLQKYSGQENKQENYPVFLASVDSLDEKNFNLVKDNYKNYYNKNMSNKNLVQTTTDEKGREIVMVRVDKTLKEMMEEKPASRWDPKYWRSEFDQIYKPIFKHKYDSLSQFIEFITDGNRGKRSFSSKKDDVVYIQATNMVNTGLDFTHSINYIKKGSWLDPARSRVKENDILLGERGVASTGRVVVIHKNLGLMNISQIIALIRIKKINPFYVGIFLKGNFGQSQIQRLQSGIGPAKLVFDEIKSIQIPILDESVQKNIESEYKKMSKYHDKAVELKKNNNEAEYKKNIETAEKMLKDLISKTEAVIRGERKDVI